MRRIWLAGLLLFCACRAENTAHEPPGAGNGGDAERSEVHVAGPELAGQVKRFCGDCHAPPRAESFPVDAWPREVARGFHFYFESSREDLAAPPEEEVVAYYQALAPERLEVPSPQGENSPDGSPLRFEPSATPAPQLEPPAVSFVGWLKLPSTTRPELVFCDMRSGEICSVAVGTGELAVEVLTTLKNPARLAVCDLDGDGQDELVAAELGSFTSEDHARGAVVWLRLLPDQRTWHQRLLVSGLGRVADVRPGDLDGDGDMDLAVAEFGHLRTGRVLWYENTGTKAGIPQFTEHLVDARHGAIHVPLADLNGDGRLDIVALISQEHEVIEAYLNEGSGEFQRQPVFAAGDPAAGSSGIQLVDLDGDGDLDVLYSNGDTFGSEDLKPYHGVTWLENRGSFPFEPRRVTDMIGVQRAIAADLDGDRDQDILAVGFLPSNLVGRPELARHDSIVWLERQASGEYRRHALESASFVHAAATVDDFDGDGDLDLAVGSFQDLAREHQPWVTIWWNAGSAIARPTSEGGGDE